MELPPEAQLERHPSTRLGSNKLAFSTTGASAESAANSSLDLKGDHLRAEDSHFLELGRNALKDKSLGVCLNTETVEEFILRGHDQDLHLHSSLQDHSCPSQNPKGEDPIPGGRHCSQLEPVLHGRRDCSVHFGIHGAETPGEFVLQEPDQDLNLLTYSLQDRHSPNLKGDGLGGGPCCSTLEPVPKELKDSSVCVCLSNEQLAVDLHGQEVLKNWSLLNSMKDYCGPRPAEDQNGDALLPKVSFCHQFEAGQHVLKDTLVRDGRSKADIEKDLRFQEHGRDDLSLAHSRPRFAQDQPADDFFPEGPCCLELVSKGLGYNSVNTSVNNAEPVEELYSRETGRGHTPQDRGFLSLRREQRSPGGDNHRLENQCCSRLESLTKGLKDTFVCVGLDSLDVVVEQGQASGLLGDVPEVLAVLSLHEDKCGPPPDRDHRVDDLLPESQYRSRSKPRHSGLKQSSFCVHLSQFLEHDGQVSVRHRELKPQNYSADAVDLDREDVVFKKLSNSRVGQTSKNYRAHSSPAANSGQGTHELPLIVKHKQSSITFSDYGKNHAAVYGSLDDGESSEDEDDERADGEGDEDDDVFLELWPSTERRVHQRHKRESGKFQSDCSRGPTGGDACRFEAEPDSSTKEESPQLEPPWSESMSRLMRKLDQLNLDIEEALSAGSSPSDTPRTARKKRVFNTMTSEAGAGRMTTLRWEFSGAMLPLHSGNVHIWFSG